MLDSLTFSDIAKGVALLAGILLILVVVLHIAIYKQPLLRLINFALIGLAAIAIGANTPALLGYGEEGLQIELNQVHNRLIETDRELAEVSARVVATTGDTAATYGLGYGPGEGAPPMYPHIGTGLTPELNPPVDLGQSTEILRAWLRQDPGNRKRLENWLRAEGYGGSTTIFLYAQEDSQLREKALEAFGLSEPEGGS